MTAQIHRRRVGDLRTVLPVTLQQPDSSGVLAAINLTGLAVTFKMVNAATGATKIAGLALLSRACKHGVSLVEAWYLLFFDNIVNFQLVPVGRVKANQH